MVDRSVSIVSAHLDLSEARRTRLHASGQALLYDVAKRVRSGYHWWLVGEVPAEKVLAVVAKLAHQYDTAATAVTRSRRKAAGDPSATLFVWPLRNDSAGYTTCFGFLLLATEHLDGEVMYDGRRKPVRVNLYANSNAIFHLIPRQVTVERRLSRPGPKPKKKSGSAEANSPQKVMMQRALRYEFDWQLSAKSAELMRERFAASVSNPAALESLRRAYSALPMTSGYRSQLKAALTETKAAWKRGTTPAVLEAKRAIKAGERADPFSISTLPYIRGFPRLYDDPPMTLALYLDITRKTRREVERRALETVRADHSGDQL